MINKNEHIRTINSVTNLDTGKTIYANEFFNQDENIIWSFREKCQDAIKGKRPPFLVCDTCGQLIQISGGKGVKGKITYFKHLKDSNDCPIKTDTKLSKSEILRGKFNGQKEGSLHIETKGLIAQFLEFNKIENKGISSVEVEKISRDNRNYLEWKRPDVTSIFNDKKLVFEIQLSTTFLDVICERQHFYKENNTFILWVFKQFETEADKQRFTQKDVFYSNNRNAFILNEEAIILSQNNKDLYLLCQYQKPKADREKIKYNWESKYVCLSDLTFDETSYKVYYFDVNQEENKVKAEIKNRISERKKREEERLRELEEGQKEQDRLYIEEVERENLHQKNKSERQKTKEKDQLNYEKINILFFDRLKKYGYLSPLQSVYRSDLYEISSNIGELFKSGYSPTKEDIKFLKDEYNTELSIYKTPDRHSILYFLSITIFYIKLRHNPAYLNLFPKIERVLSAILSIKERKVIGYNFKTLVEIPHQFIGNKTREEFTLPILQAINKYYGYEKFIKEQDTKKTLEKKILLLKGNIPPIREEYKTVLNLIFKELIP